MKKNNVTEMKVLAQGEDAKKDEQSQQDIKDYVSKEFKGLKWYERMSIRYAIKKIRNNLAKIRNKKTRMKEKEQRDRLIPTLTTLLLLIEVTDDNNNAINPQDLEAMSTTELIKLTDYIILFAAETLGEDVSKFEA